MEEIFSFLLASIMLTLAPGPDILLVFSESLAKGPKSALMLAAGLVCGLPFHTLVLVLGWGQFIGLYPNLIVVLKICGALYFLYLATQTFNNLKIEVQKTALAKKDPVKIFKKGMLMNLLNPKVSLFFWLFFPGFLFHDTLYHGTQYAILGGLFMLQAAIVFTFVSIAAATLIAPMLSNPKNLYWMNFGQGILLIGIAIYLLF